MEPEYQVPGCATSNSVNSTEQGSGYEAFFDESHQCVKGEDFTSPAL